MLRRLVFVAFLLVPVLAFTQTENAEPPATPSIPNIPEGQRPRVFVTDSQSWEVGGGGGGTGGTFGSGGSGGARPQTAEIVKTFGERCPQVIVNNKKDKADYIVVLDHEGGKSWFNHKNKVAVFASDSGDSVMSHSNYSLGGAVQDACGAIAKHWIDHGGLKRSTTTTTDTATKVEVADRVPPPNALYDIIVDSNPTGADLEVDGEFVASTPSALHLKAGQHTITVKKSGYQTWERKITVGVGNVHLQAELEKTAQ